VLSAECLRSSRAAETESCGFLAANGAVAPELEDVFVLKLTTGSDPAVTSSSAVVILGVELSNFMMCSPPETNKPAAMSWLLYSHPDSRTSVYGGF
jgi:hypothetical protein